MADKPCVFHLITRLLKGGAEEKTIQTVLGLEGYEFTVGHGAAFDPDQVERLHRHGIETVRFRTIRHYNPITAIPAVFAVARYIRTHDFDIVHTHSTEAGIIGRFAADLAGVPHIVHTVHGIPFAEDRHALLEAFVLRCERLAAHRTDRMITNADAIKDEYLSRGIGVEDQYRTVYSGIDLEAFDDASPADDIDADGVRILTVGRLADGKGFEDLLDAVSRLGSDDVHLYIVGDGPLRAQLLDRIDALELAESVTLLGYRDDIPQIMAASDIFVLASYREGTPRVITEAMARGLPVVSTAIAGIPEQVIDGETGYLIDPGDVDSLIDSLEALCESPELRDRLGAAAVQYISKFSRDTMLQELDSVYSGIL